MVVIIRDCAEFVRSAACMHGEDPMPAGWPDSGKERSEREKFIGMGCIKPRRSTTDHDHWANWNAICRNIWLWRETNRILLEVAKGNPDMEEELPRYMLPHMIIRVDELLLNSNEKVDRRALMEIKWFKES